MEDIEYYKYRYNLYSYIKNDNSTSNFHFKITRRNIELYKNLLLIFFIFICIIFVIYIKELNISSVLFILIFCIYIYNIFKIQDVINNIINNSLLNSYSDFYKLLNVLYLQYEQRHEIENLNETDFIEFNKKINENIVYIENTDTDIVIEDLKKNLDVLKFVDLDYFKWNEYLYINKKDKYFNINNIDINENYNKYKDDTSIINTNKTNFYEIKIIIYNDSDYLKTISIKHREYLEELEKIILKFINDKYKTNIKSLKNLKFYKSGNLFKREINNQIELFNRYFLYLLILTIILISLIIHIITNNYIISIHKI